MIHHGTCGSPSRTFSRRHGHFRPLGSCRPPLQPEVTFAAPFYIRPDSDEDDVVRSSVPPELAWRTALVLDQRVGPKEVEDAEELARSAGGRADELEDDDINALRKAAQEKLGDELPAARQVGLQGSHQHWVPGREGLRSWRGFGLGHSCGAATYTSIGMRANSCVLALGLPFLAPARAKLSWRRYARAKPPYRGHAADPFVPARGGWRAGCATSCAGGSGRVRVPVADGSLQLSAGASAKLSIALGQVAASARREASGVMRLGLWQQVPGQERALGFLRVGERSGTSTKEGTRVGGTVRDVD